MKDKTIDVLKKLYKNYNQEGMLATNVTEALNEAIKALEDKGRLEGEVKRLSKRDCNATIQLSFDDGENPFAIETLKIVDVGVSDNIYVVESKTLAELKKKNEELETKLNKGKEQK